ncbi:S1C family serine protease [Capilliphycus salinus ALCB114379]|uniref:S1C family serine protease n=1 Tax=Capilliphycus salinus TaxID=2768948 RepID=UPI0039A69F47
MLSNPYRAEKNRFAGVSQSTRSFLKTLLLGTQVIGASLLFLGVNLPAADSRTPSYSSGYTMSSPSSSENVPASMSEMARQVTVRIFANRSVGSGVIINRSGQGYTVVTNAHVVGNHSGSFMILTADGQMHGGRLVSSSRHLDVAVLQFNSSGSHQVAKIGNSSGVRVGESVMAAGFPNWLNTTPGKMQDTRDWGNRPFQLTQGQVGMVPNRSLVEGYQLGYTNDIRSGMSGGPVFNQRGELIGINGRSKFALSADKVYRYSDGSSPSPEQVQQMKALSWAIPVSNLSLRGQS